MASRFLMLSMVTATTHRGSGGMGSEPFVYTTLYRIISLITSTTSGRRSGSPPRCMAKTILYCFFSSLILSFHPSTVSSLSPEWSYRW